MSDAKPLTREERAEEVEHARWNLEHAPTAPCQALPGACERLTLRYEATVQARDALLEEARDMLDNLTVEAHAPNCTRGCECSIGDLRRRIDKALEGEG